jgi:uncharacterized phage protein (TIGR02218 family)
MTYEAVELGPLGSPVEMFLFQRRETCWQYTSSDAVQVYGNRTYVPRTVSRGAFDRNDEAGSSTVQVRMDRTLKVCTQFLDGSSPTPVSLRIYRRHRTDAEAIVLFKGVVANAELRGEEIILTCVSPLSADEKPVPRELIMRTCPHVLYGQRCLLNPENWEVTGGEVDSIVSGTIYKISGIAGTGFADDDFAAGVLVKNSTGQRGFIQSSTFSIYANPKHAVRLLQPMVGLVVTDEITLYYGCDRKHSTCRDKFDNIPNFGGFPLHPERNPFIEIKVGEENN